MVPRVCNPNGPDYDPIDDGEIIQISFSTTLCDYLQPAGFLEIQLTIERAVTCEFIVSANTLEVCTDDPPTKYDISHYKAESNLIITLHKQEQGQSIYNVFRITVNGEFRGTTRHAALCSGRVDGASFWVSDHTREQLRTDRQVIRYAVFNGPDAAMEAQTRLDALRDSPAFQRTTLSRERAMEDGKSEVEDREETADLGGDSGQSSNTNIPPGKDYTKMQDASNTVWRRAVDLTLGSSVYANVKATDDGIMDEWVKTRGGKLTPSDYDYLVYSAGFGWPDAIQKVGTDADFLKVQEKYKEIIKYF